MQTGENSTIYLSDMSRCLPKEALSTDTRQGCWRLVEYETERGQGVLMYALAGMDAPSVEYPLNVQGWHNITIGLWSFLNDIGWVKVKLTGDAHFTHLSRGKPDRFTLEESFWKAADLTGQSIIFGQENRGAYVAFIVLEPLSADQVEEIRRDRARSDTKRLVAHNDADYLRRGIRESVESYRYTDFTRIYWEAAAGSRCLYATRIGEFGEDPRSRPAKALHDQGIDLLATAAKYAHEAGLEIYPSIRVEMFGFPPPRDEETVTRFYREHPEWHCVDRDGTPIDRMSYAFPQVRGLITAILAEMAEYEVDGVGLLYHRGPPYLLYEEPLIQGFQAEYGQDPRLLGEWDERWLAYRAGFMTNFMRELRQALDEVGSRRDVRLKVGAVVPAEPAENRFYGLDLRTWIAEGLVDELIPYPDGHGDRHIFFDNARIWCADPPRHEIPLGYWASLTKGTPCKLCPAIMPRSMPSREYRRRAMRCYEAGADGLFFWDAYGRNVLTAQWRTLRRLGHVEELLWTRTYEELAGERPWSGRDPQIPELSFIFDDPEVKTVKLKRLGGFTMDRYPADWSG